MPRRKDRTEDRMLKKLWKREHKKAEQEKKHKEHNVVPKPVAKPILIPPKPQPKPQPKPKLETKAELIITEVSKNEKKSSEEYLPPTEIPTEEPTIHSDDIEITDITQLITDKPREEIPKEITPPPDNSPKSIMADELLSGRAILFNSLPRDIKTGHIKSNMIYKSINGKHYHFSHPTKGIPKPPNNCTKIIKDGNYIGFISDRRIKY